MGGGDAAEAGTPADTVFTADDFASLGICRVLPELMAGPFPTVDQIERRDIAEGMAGHPLRVGIQVVDATGEPIPGAGVEIWHCDVDGDYSAYADGATADDAGPGTTFFRGYQVANDEGIVELHTRFPGWYPGRAIHIHAAVRVDDTTVLTTQFLFDDAVNRRITAEEPYADHGPPDTTNAEDGVSGGDPGGDGLLMTVLDDAAIGGSRALIVVGVDPAD
jgi:protocatechuate 3,4-dioxygenase beta subunit